MTHGPHCRERGEHRAARRRRTQACFFLVLGQRKTPMRTPFFPYSFGSRTAGLSHPAALCKSYHDLKGDSFREHLPRRRGRLDPWRGGQRPAEPCPTPSLPAQCPGRSHGREPGSASSLREPCEEWGHLPIRHSCGARAGGKPVRPPAMCSETDPAGMERGPGQRVCTGVHSSLGRWGTLLPYIIS